MGLNVNVILNRTKAWLLASLLTSAGILLPVLITSAQAEPVGNNPVVAINTNLGEILVELNPKAAPKTVENFLAYTSNHYYDGLIFHRVIDDFMIQAGGYWYDRSPKKPTRSEVVNESNNGLKNQKGTIAMARLADPNSAQAQFFINLRDNHHLNATKDHLGYTVFGKVIAGQSTVDAIANVPVEYISPLFANIPTIAVQIDSLKLKETQ
jgi:peptidyl-prolyl cis-trans isomerase A (cyclophilin A)